MVDDENNGGDIQVANTENLPAVIETAPIVLDTQNEIKKISSSKRRLQVATDVVTETKPDAAIVDPEIPQKRGRGRPKKSQAVMSSQLPAVIDVKRISGNKLKDAQINLPEFTSTQSNTSENGTSSGDRPIINAGNNKDEADRLYNATNGANIIDAEFTEMKSGVSPKARLISPGHRLNPPASTGEKTDTTTKDGVVKTTLKNIKLWGSSSKTRETQENPNNDETIEQTNKDFIAKAQENYGNFKRVIKQFIQEKREGTFPSEEEAQIPQLKEEIKKTIYDLEQTLKGGNEENNKSTQLLISKLQGLSDEADKEFNSHVSRIPKTTSKAPIVLGGSRDDKLPTDAKAPDITKLTDSELEDLSKKVKEETQQIQDGSITESTPVFTKDIKDKLDKEIADRKQLDKDIDEVIATTLKKERENETPEAKLKREAEEAGLSDEEKVKKEQDLKDAAKTIIQNEINKDKTSATESVGKEIGALKLAEKLAKKLLTNLNDPETIKKMKDEAKVVKDHISKTSSRIGEAELSYMRYKSSKAEGSIGATARPKHGLAGSLMGSSHRSSGSSSGSSHHGSLTGHYDSKRNLFGGGSSRGGINTTHHGLSIGGNTGRTPMVGRAGLGSLVASHTGAKDASGSIGGTHIGAKDASGSLGGYHGSKDASGSIGGASGGGRDASGSIGGTHVPGVNFTREAGGSIRPNTGKDATGSILGGGSGNKDATGSIMGAKHKMVTGAQTMRVGDVIGKGEDGSPVYATEQDVQMTMPQRNGMVVQIKQGNALGFGTNPKVARPSGMIRGNLKDTQGNAIGVGADTKAAHPSQIMAGYKKTAMVTGKREGSAVTGSPKTGNPVGGVGHTSGIMRGYVNKGGAVTATSKEGNPVGGVGHTSGIMQGYTQNGEGIAVTIKKGNPVAGVGHTSGIMRGYANKGGAVTANTKEGNPVSGVGHTSGIMRGYTDQGEAVTATSKEGNPVAGVGHTSGIMRGYVPNDGGIVANDAQGNPIATNAKGGHPSGIMRGYTQKDGTIAIGTKAGNPVATGNKGGHPSGMMRARSGKTGNPVTSSDKGGHPSGMAREFKQAKNGNPVPNGEKGGHPSKIARGFKQTKTGNPVPNGAKGGHPSGMMRIGSSIANKMRVSQANRAQFEVGEKTGNPVRVLNEATSGRPSQMMRDKFSAPVAVTASMGKNASFANVAAKSLKLRGITIPTSNKVPVITTHN